MLANCTDQKYAYISNLSDQMTLNTRGVQMFLQSQNIMVQKFQIQHNRILRIHRILDFGFRKKCQIQIQNLSHPSFVCIVGPSSVYGKCDFSDYYYTIYTTWVQCTRVPRR